MGVESWSGAERRLSLKVSASPPHSPPTPAKQVGPREEHNAVGVCFPWKIKSVEKGKGGWGEGTAMMFQHGDDTTSGNFLQIRPENGFAPYVGAAPKPPAARTAAHWRCPWLVAGGVGDGVEPWRLGR